MENFFWRINRKLHKILIAYSKNPRPGSAPYISGDTFRLLADNIYEKDSTFEPQTVKEKDIVFVENDPAILKDFFAHVHPLIQNKYILITHNGDTNIDASYVKYIDEKIIHWFAQNVCVVQEKITPIPIGLENEHYYNNGIVSIFTTLRKNLLSTRQKKDAILYSFNVDTNQKVRRPVYDILSKISIAEALGTWPNPTEYLRSVNSYKFIASPPGNGEDCIRSWEAMLIGTIPIARRSVGIEYFKSIGLPLYVIDSYDECTTHSQYDLSSKYDLIMSSGNSKALYIDYWKEKILTYKNR